MNKRLGLALGAGSTKGFAHIGALQVFEREGIGFDMISGCSMGAIIGAIYAAGTDLDMLEKFLSAIDVKSYLDIRNPFSGGLLRGDRLEELVRILTHGKTFAQTKTPFCCVAVDAQTGRLDVLESGKLHEAVRASMSIPAIFQPAVCGGKIYIDGGVIERVPCKALRDRGMDIVIGVDVGYHGGGADVASMNAYQLMNHTLNIMQWEMTRLRREECDLTIVPEVLFVKGHFQMDRFEDCVEEGRRAAQAALPKIRKLLERD